eukprot:12727989-Alexandrium_andersonii.AAC.1
MSASLVGSEMCIRDSSSTPLVPPAKPEDDARPAPQPAFDSRPKASSKPRETCAGRSADPNVVRESSSAIGAMSSRNDLADWIRAE